MTGETVADVSGIQAPDVLPKHDQVADSVDVDMQNENRTSFLLPPSLLASFLFCECYKAFCAINGLQPL
jgi:hypothetical protein